MAHPLALTDTQKAEITVLLGEGKTHAEIAKQMGIHTNTVWKHAHASAEVKDYIEEKRLELKRRVSERLLKIVEGVLDRVDDGSEDATVEPKGLELLTRALANLEKVSSSVSGENRKAAAIVTGGFTVSFQQGWGNKPAYIDAEIIKHTPELKE